MEKRHTGTDTKTIPPMKNMGKGGRGKYERNQFPRIYETDTWSIPRQYNRSMEELQKGNIAAAKAMFESVIISKSDHWPSLYGLAICDYIANPNALNRLLNWIVNIDESCPDFYKTPAIQLDLELSTAFKFFQKLIRVSRSYAENPKSNKNIELAIYKLAYFFGKSYIPDNKYPNKAVDSIFQTCEDLLAEINLWISEKKKQNLISDFNKIS